MRFDETLRVVDGRALIAGDFESPGNVRGYAQDVRVEAVGGAFINEGSIRIPTAIGLLLAREPLLRALDDLRIHVMDFRHVAELHKAVGSQDLVCGCISK